MMRTRRTGRWLQYLSNTKPGAAGGDLSETEHVVCALDITFHVCTKIVKGKGEEEEEEEGGGRRRRK